MHLRAVGLWQVIYLHRPGLIDVLSWKFIISVELLWKRCFVRFAVPAQALLIIVVKL